jgi:hypothetical protein
MAAPQDTSGSPGITFYGGYQVYSESGVDLTLLRENLKHTIEQRFAENSRSLLLVDALREASRAPMPNPITPSTSPMLDAPAILRQLAEHQVEYVLIGGLAMIAQGSAYVTKDLDICYRRTPTNLAALVAAFAPLQPYMRGAPPGLPFRFDVPTIQAGLNFTLTTACGDVDMLGEVSGVGRYEQALALSEEKTVHGLTVRVLSIDGLIAAKKAAGRIKDKLHVLELEELKKLRDAQP